MSDLTTSKEKHHHHHHHHHHHKQQEAPAVQEAVSTQTDAATMMQQMTQEVQIGSVSEEDSEEKKRQLLEEKKEHFGTLFFDIADLADEDLQQTMVLQVSNSLVARNTFDENLSRVFSTITKLENDIPAKEKDRSPIQKKKVILTKRIKEFYIIVRKKLDLIRDKIYSEQKEEVKKKLSDNPARNAEVIGGLSKKLFDYNGLLKKYGDCLGILNGVLKQDLEEEDIDYFSSLIDHNFVMGATKEDDFGELLSGEITRAMSLESMLKAGGILDEKQYIFGKVYAEGMIENVKLDKTIEDAKRDLEFRSKGDPVKIPEALFPKGDRVEVEKINSEQQDILMSSRLQMSLLNIVLDKAEKEASANNVTPNQRLMINIMGNMSGSLINLSNETTKAIEESQETSQKQIELFEKCVLMSKNIGIVFGHMKSVYSKFCQRISDYGEIDSDKKIIDMLSHMYKATFYQSEEEKKPKNVEECIDRFMKVTKDADRMLAAADYEFDAEILVTDEYGIEFDRKYTYSIGENESKAEVLLDQIKAARKQDKETKEKQEITAEEFERLRAQKEEQEEEVRQKELDSQALSDEISSDEQTQTQEPIRISYTGATLKEYKPKSALGKISEFTDYQSNKVEGVGKMKAFFDKKKLRGRELSTRMEKHTRRFLSSRDGVTDGDMADYSNVLMESSGVLSEMAKEKNLSEDQSRRLNLISALHEAKDSSIIGQILTEARPFIASRVDERLEVVNDSPFYNAHPNTAKVVILHKLLSMVLEDSLEGVSEEYKGRIDALYRNVSLMYNAIKESKEYKLEVKKQRLRLINQELDERKSKLRRFEADLEHYKPKEVEEDYQERIEADTERFKADLSEMTSAATRFLLQRSRVNSLRKKQKSQQEIESSISDLQKSIDKAKLDAAKRKKAIPLAAEYTLEDEIMDHGAESYMNTILDNGVLKDVTEADRAEIKKLIKAQIPYMMPKDKIDMTKYKAEDVRSFVRRIEVRISSVLDLPSVLESCRQEDRKDYREFFLKRMISGQSYISFDEFEPYKKKRAELMDKSEGYLDHCKFYPKNKTVRLRIIGMKKASKIGKDAHMRGQRRVERMQNITTIIKDLFKKYNIEPPESLYEFKKSHAKDKEDSIGAYINDYKAYIETYFKEKFSKLKKKDLDFSEPLEFSGNTYKNMLSIKDLILKFNSEYGVEGKVAELVESLGDDLNLLKHEEYVARLAEKVEELNKEDEKKKVRVAKVDPEAEKEEIQKIDGRIAQFMQLQDGRFSHITETLMDDKRFVEHIVADSEDEYEYYLATIIPAASRVMDELLIHPYFDQYIIERKDKITTYIHEGMNSDVTEYLSLSEVDKKINETKINGKTFDEIVSEKIGGGKKAKPKDAIAHSFDMSVLLQEGAAALLDEKGMSVRRERFSANMEVLNATIKEIIDGLDAEQKKKFDEEALLVSVYQIERNDLFYSNTENYKTDIKKRLLPKIDMIIKEQQAAKQMIDAKAEADEQMKEIISEKEKGRKLFNTFFDQADKEFAGIGDPASIVAEEKYKKELSEIIAIAGEYMSDEFLESVYTTVLKRMVIHTAKGEYIQLLNDKNVVLRIKAFSMAVDSYIDKNEDIRDEQRNSLKKGLFELYGDQLLNGRSKDLTTYTEGVEYYTKLLDEFLAKKLDGTYIAKFIMDDKGGFSSFSQNQAKGEEESQTKLREQYEAKVMKIAPKDIADKIEKFSPEERVLFLYLMQNRSGLIALRGTVAQLTGEEEQKNISVGDSAVIMSYLSGKGLLNSPISLNFEVLNRLLEKSTDIESEITQAAVLVEEFRKTKDLKLKFDIEQKSEKDKYDIDLTVAELEKINETANRYAIDISADKLLTNKEKLWRYYTVLRTYSNTFDTYDRLKSLGLIDKSNPKYDDLFNAYASLQEYFGVEKESMESRLKIYTNSICVKLGIYSTAEFENKDKLNELATSRIEEDRKREEVDAIIKEHLFEKTGHKAQAVVKVIDAEEKVFPQNVVAATKQIDRWLSENALQWMGDSESNFAMDVLGRPMRERLFVYYAVEKDKLKTPTGLDVALSLNGYIPSLKAFTGKIKRSRANIIHSAASQAKRISLVRSTGALDTYGKIQTSKLESAMRLLDDRGFRLGEYLQRLTGERVQAEDKSLPETVRVRQACYIKFMQEVDKQKELLTGKNQKEAKADKTIQIQSKKVELALRQLIMANQKLDDEFDEKDAITQTKDAKIVEEEKEGLGEKIVSGIGTAASKGNSIVGILDEKRKFFPWKLNVGDLDRMAKATGGFYSIDILSSVVGTILKAKEIASDQLSVSGKVAQSADTLESVNDIVEKVGSFVTFLKPAAEETVKTVTTGVTGAITATAGTVKTIVALQQYHTISKAEESALRYADEVDSKSENKKGGELDLSSVVKNTAAMQKRTTRNEAANNALKAAGGVVSLIGAVVPVAAPITGSIEAIISVATKIHAFWSNKDQREKTIDEFIDMNSMYEKFMVGYDKLSKETKEKYGKSKDDIIKTLRMEALRQMHYSTMEEFFRDITTQYATVLYRQIFFMDDGAQITADLTDEIEKRKPLHDLFPKLRFGYPTTEGQWPSPTIEDMAHDLMRKI